MMIYYVTARVLNGGMALYILGAQTEKIQIFILHLLMEHVSSNAVARVAVFAQNSLKLRRTKFVGINLDLLLHHFPHA